MQPQNKKQNSGRRKELPRVALAWRGKTRTFTIRPWLLGSVVTVFVLFMACYFSATIYLIYRDDILDSALARQIELQFAYEERIALLRSEIDRVTSRHLVETQSLEEQLDILLEQQEVLARRQALLDSLIARARAEGISPAAAAMPLPVPRPSRGERWTGAPAPREPLAYAPREDRRIEAITGAVVQSDTPRAASPAAEAEAVRPMLLRLRSSFEDAEQRQDLALDVLAAATRQEVSRLSGLMSRLGVRPPRAAETPEGVTGAGLGGPFVPAESGFLDDALSVGGELLHLAQIRAAAQLLPLGSPVPGAAVTSRFGYRTDPFLKRPAMHAGVDLRADSGTPVRATAPGKVVSAGWSGGYGRMVEIEHAQGLTTRFAHMSKILVGKGQKVAAGTVIGMAGSTGRSTGPHLHYETHRGGRAVDPTAFLEASRF
jgi:murein DD-endopeptidase MepM/ murein hydrolase activator NlpD